MTSDRLPAGATGPAPRAARCTPRAPRITLLATAFLLLALLALLEIPPHARAANIVLQSAQKVSFVTCQAGCSLFSNIDMTYTTTQVTTPYQTVLVDVSISYPRNTWLAWGVGAAPTPTDMINAEYIFGANPAYNVGNPPYGNGVVAVNSKGYLLSDQYARSGTLASNGIFNASFTQAGGVSVLNFTIDTALAPYLSSVAPYSKIGSPSQATIVVQV